MPTSAMRFNGRLEFIVMSKIYLLEVVDHSTGIIVGSMKGTAYQLSMHLQTVLENLPDSYGVTIIENEA